MIHLRVLSFLTPLLLLGRDAHATHQEPPGPSELRYTWSPETTLRYEVRSSMRGQLRIGVGDVATHVPLDYDVQLGLRLECERVDTRQRHQARLVFEWIRIEERQGGLHATFDTREPAAIEGHPLEPLYRELLALAREPLGFEVGPQGRPSFSVAARERLASIGSPLDPTQLEVELSRIFPELPTGSATVGKTWKDQRSVEMPTLGNLTLETRNTLTERTPEKTRIELQFVPVVEEDVARAAAAGLPPLEVVRAAGWQEFDGEGGLLREHVAELAVRIDLREADLSLRGELTLRSHVRRL